MRRALGFLAAAVFTAASCSAAATPPASTVPASASPPPTPSLSPMASPSPAASGPSPAASVAPAAVVGRDWVAVDVAQLSPAVGGAARVRAAIEGPNGLVAAGMGESPAQLDSTDDVPTSWTSTDGRTWVRGGDLPVPRGLVAADVHALARVGDGFVAVGDSLQGGGAIAWSSPDGTTWSSTVLDAGTCAWGIAARQQIIVVIGIVGPCHAGGGGHPVAWASRDRGRTWARQPVPGPAGAWGAFTTLVATPDRFVAYGSFTRSRPVDTCGGLCTSPDPPPFGPGMWLSADGASWQGPVEPGIFATSPIAQVVAGPAGLVAWGSSGEAGTLWISSDGRQWTVAPEQPFRTSSDLVFGGSPSALVALAGNPYRDSGAIPAAYSTDGVQWVIPPVPAGLTTGSVSLIAPFRGGFVAFGLREEPVGGGECPATKITPETCRTIATVWLTPPTIE